jgi:HAD superfamily hydrolase (TIGR01509 family)
MYQESVIMEPIIVFPDVDLNAIDGVIMDLDNTLYHYQTCHDQALTFCYDQFSAVTNLSFSLRDFRMLYRKYRTLVTEKLAPQGACRSRLIAFQWMFESLQMTDSWSLAAQFDTWYWEAFINKMHLAPEADHFLRHCQQLALDICVLTDMTSSIQVKKLEHLGIRDHVKYLVTSEEVGIEKPDFKMFHHALAKLKLSPSQVLMVGDSLAKDIRPAELLGMQTIHIEWSDH